MRKAGPSRVRPDSSLPGLWASLSAVDKDQAGRAEETTEGEKLKLKGFECDQCVKDTEDEQLPDSDHHFCSWKCLAEYAAEVAANIALPLSEQIKRWGKFMSDQAINKEAT